jgi:hypothetical protein
MIEVLTKFFMTLGFKMKIKLPKTINHLSFLKGYLCYNGDTKFPIWVPSPAKIVKMGCTRSQPWAITAYSYIKGVDAKHTKYLKCCAYYSDILHCYKSYKNLPLISNLMHLMKEDRILEMGNKFSPTTQIQ